MCGVAGGKEGHAYSDSRADAFGATNIDMAVMEFDTAVDNKEPQAGTGQLSHVAAAVERAEKPFQILRRNPDTLVTNDKQRVLSHSLDGK